MLRDALSVDDAALGRFEKCAIQQTRAAAWPGTQRLGGEATVLWIHLDAVATAVLASAVDGLYDWRQPRTPEDLCLLRADGSPVLVTISHEADGYLVLTPAEQEVVLAACPWLAALVASDPDALLDR